MRGAVSVDFFRGLAGKGGNGDGLATGSLGVVGVVETADWDGSALVVEELGPGIKHVLGNELAGFFVIAVADLVEDVSLTVENFAGEGVLVGIHFIDGGHLDVAVGAGGLFGECFVVGAAPEFGSGAILMPHDANVGACCFPFPIIFIGEGLDGVGWVQGGA